MELWTQSSCNTFDSFRRSHYGCTSGIDVVYNESMIFLGWWGVLCIMGFEIQDFVELGHCAQGDSCILAVVLIRL